MAGWFETSSTEISNTVRKLEKLGTSQAGIGKLRDRIKRSSDEDVTSAFINSTSNKQRLILLNALSAVRSERHIPLLISIVQFSDEPEQRAYAAQILARMSSPAGPFRESAIVYALGDSFSRETDARIARDIATWLDRFLTHTCKVDIGAMKASSQPVNLFGFPVIYRRIDVAVVREWWKREGREKAASGAFDHDAPKR